MNSSISHKIVFLKIFLKTFNKEWKPNGRYKNDDFNPNQPQYNMHYDKLRKLLI